MTTDLLTDLDRLGDVLERTSRPIDVHQIVDRSPVALDVSLLDLRPGDRLIDDGMALVVSGRRPSRASTRRWRAAAACDCRRGNRRQSVDLDVEARRRAGRSR